MLAVPKWLRGLAVNQLFGSSILLGQPKRCEQHSTTIIKQLVELSSLLLVVHATSSRQP